MKAVSLLLLLPALALAQGYKPSASFKLLAGSQVCFNSATCTDTIAASASTGGMVLNSGVANSGSNVGYILDTTTSLAAARAIISLRAGGVEEAQLNGIGQWFTTLGYLNPNGNNGMAFSGGTTVISAFSGTNVTTNGANSASFGATGITALSGNPVPMVHLAQTSAAVAMEFGRSAAAGTGLLAVTFATAFGTAPACACVDENATPVLCGISVAPTTTAVTFFIPSARADTLDWQCNGLK